MDKPCAKPAGRDRVAGCFAANLRVRRSRGWGRGLALIVAAVGAALCGAGAPDWLRRCRCLSSGGAKVSAAVGGGRRIGSDGHA